MRRSGASGLLAGALLWGATAGATEPEEPAAREGREEPEGDEEITVEAGGAAPDPQETSASVTVVQVDASLPASSDVSTVVDSTVGTTVTRLGGLGDWSGVSIRGSSQRQVQVAIDGVPLNPDGSSGVNLSELPLWAFERVELYRGSAPPELAAAPIGGVVDLRTGEGREGVGASASAGSFGTGRGTATARVPLELGRTPADVLVIAEAFGTRGDFPYFDDNGTEYNLDDDGTSVRTNNDKRQLNAHARLRLGPRRARLTLLEAALWREEGLPGHANNPVSSVRLDTRRSLTAAQGELRRGPWRGTLRASALLRHERYDDRQGEVGVGRQHNHDRFASLGLLAHQERALGAAVVPALTVAGRLDRYVTTDLLVDQEGSAARRLALTPSLSADLRPWGERLTVSPVAQVQLLDNRALGEVPFTDTPVAPDTEDTLLAFTPRLGLLLRPVAPLALKANVGRYLRPPDFTELFGDRGAVTGNTELRPERGTQWDVGARVEAPEWWAVQGAVELGHFQSRTEDLIVLVQNAQRTSVPLNLDEAWVGGVEAALSLRWTWLEATSSLTWTDSVNLSEQRQYANKQLPRIPTWDAYQRTAFVWEDRVRLGHTWSYADGNYWDRTNFYRAAPRSLHGLFARVQPGPRWPAAELDVLNLLDQRVQTVPRNPLDPDDPATVRQPITDFVGYPLPGRTFLFTLSWTRLPRSADGSTDG